MKKHDNLYIGVFVAGWPKCGSSTVSNWLFQHPQLTPVGKDPVARKLWIHKPKQTARECYRFIGVDDTFKIEPKHCNRGGENPYPVYPISWAARQSHRLCWVTSRLARKMGAPGLSLCDREP